ncbi:MAG: periplasmic heavy metal sensor [Pirellulales bacterium]|nr:periplasmic heavy metal sensor [Pirellulales bacterium]
MSRTSKRFLIVASVALNLAFVGIWLAHAIAARLGEEPAPSPHATAGRIWCPLYEKLNVTDAQWNRIEPILREFRKSAQSVCQDMSKLRLEMVELIAAPTPNLEAIAAKQEEIQAGQRKMQGLVISHLLAEKEILTPEQQERLFTMIREQSGCNRKGPMIMSGRPHSGVGHMFRDEPASQ